MGRQAPGMRRVLAGSAIGGAMAAAALPFLAWERALLVGWNGTAAAFLASAWSVMLRADGAETAEIATREDETRRTAAALLLAGSLASLFAVGFVIHAAAQATGSERTLLIAAAVLTVVQSWAVTNTVFTLRYADLHHQARASIDFGSAADGDNDELPDYRDFAYVAFTIGMCYQVSDTALRDKRIRRVALVHAMVSYVFGVFIIAAAINGIAGVIA